MRNATSAMLSALAASEMRPAIFVAGTFVTGPVYLWTGAGNIDWGGHTWQGLGTLGSVSTVEESSTVEAKNVTLTLTGLDPAWLTHVLGEVRQGLPVTVYIGLFATTAPYALIPNPLLSFAGRMDEPIISLTGDNCTLNINCESRLFDMNVAYNRRYTDEDQKLDYPGDRAFEFVSSLQELTIYWGRTPNSHNI